MRPFVDRPITDIRAASELAVQAAAHWELPEPELLRAGMNAIYRSGDVVLRISAPSAPARASLALAERLLAAGLRVTRPVRTDTYGSGGLYATAWEHIERTGEPIDWSTVGAMVRLVHTLNANDLPSEYPLPRPVDFPWWDFDTLLADIGNELDDEARRGIEQAVDRWPDWANQDGAVVCHGDVHPGNVIMATDGPVLIDWDLMCLAPPGWDHAPLMTLTERWGGEPDAYEAYAEGYGASLRNQPSAEAFAELRLVAATLMRVRAGMRNAAAMPEARRRLAYWRGESDAPVWQAQ
ncbi:MAG: hypothetical protein ACI9N0_002932 [Ilumatobacter sp.]|jgi:hypothetical protein